MEIAVAVAVITGLTQAIKIAGINSRYIPIVAIIIGVGYGLTLFSYDVQGAVDGIIAGLTAVGLYRTVQKSVE